MNSLEEKRASHLTRERPAAKDRRAPLRFTPLPMALGLMLGITLAGTTGRIDSAGAAEPASTPMAMSMPSDELIAKVREVTQKYQTVAAAITGGYVQGTPCVSGPDRGAMGIHYVHLDWIKTAVLDVNMPSALIYEPQADGTQRLVGVEYLVFAEVWDNNNPNTPASLEGNLLNYIAFPNRYGLPAIYEIHVWAWEANPLGSNADWNTHVTCDHQPLTH
jgi:hypothetical protein